MHRLIRILPRGLRRFLKSLPGATRLRDAFYTTASGQAPAAGSLRPVVYLPTWLEWDEMKQRPQYLLEAFARAGHEVWFVDPRLSTPRTTGSGVHLVPSLRPTPGADVIIYTHFAPTRALVGRYQRPVVVYDLLDDLSIYDPDETHLPEHRRVRYHHRDLVADADVVVVSSRVLAAKHRPERDDLILVENGVDLDLFTPDGPQAADLGPGPVVGYHGAISPWFDFSLMAEVAARRPELSFVLVGPVDDRVAGDAEALGRLPNVTILPARPAVEVAAFVRGFDVGLVPFVVDEMTRGVTPLKMFEYLASAVPVVATPLPACVDHPAVDVADDAEGFASAVDAALRLDPARRAALRHSAEEASWDRRLRPLLDRLDALGLRRV